ncbi:MAG: hypothetical protein WCE94_03520 [Candidatus Methanoperedens sp.]
MKYLASVYVGKTIKEDVAGCMEVDLIAECTGIYGEENLNSRAVM